MIGRIRRESPVPLYHQIAEAVRNAIAVGELSPGERLPPVRRAARDWGVNLHTVRQAYRSLEGEGLVRMDGARGTVVLGGAAGDGGMAGELDAFLADWVRVGRTRFGLTRVQLGQLLLRGEAEDERPRVYVLECSRAQAEGHCEELMGAWRVDARPLVLWEVEGLPAGIVVGTYFHYNDVRQRWPSRLDEVRFVAIAPDPSLPERLPPRSAAGVGRDEESGGGAGGRRRLLVCEFDEAKALNIVADLKTVFPEERYVVEPRVLADAASLPRAVADEVVLVAPRVWGGLTDAQRRGAVHIRYRVRARDLEALGETYGWERVPAADGAV